MSNDRCPTCHSDDPEVQGWRPLNSDGDWRFTERHTFPILNCPDPYHNPPTPFVPLRSALKEVSSHE